MKARIIFQLLLVVAIVFSSCESSEERQKRLARIEQEKRELNVKRLAEEAERAAQLEKERLDREMQLARERQEKAIYDKFINNSLFTGATPYAYCYGINSSCSDWGCSQIKVKTPYNSDVLVTIKRGDLVVRHAYISAGSSYTFELPNGTYQPFFYYGKGWNPEKVMKETDCGTLKGGFIANEDFGKDSPQKLANDILTYELILQQSGNFSTKPSNANEAL